VFIIAYLAALNVCLIIDYVIFDTIAKVDNFNINLRVCFHYIIGHNSKVNGLDIN